MSYDRPDRASKIRINFCSPRELAEIPGVGRKTVDMIVNYREAEGNITPEMFSTFGIRHLPAAMESVDFEPWTRASEQSYQSRDRSPMAPGPSYTSPAGPPNPYADDWRYPPKHDYGGRGYQDFRYGYQSMATGMSAQDPGQDWRWNQYRSPPPLFPQHQRVKQEPYDLRDKPATPTGEPKVETRAAPKVNVPKGITFDGKTDWQAFITKFTSYADREAWNSKTRREVLSWVLEGAASKFYANLVKRNPGLDYFEVVDKLAKRFDMRDLPETSQMLFNAASQHPKESLNEWCDRLSNMAIHAFPDWSDDQISRQVILRFCQGCSDKEAGFHAINAKPKTLEEAVDVMRRFQQSSMAIYGRPKREIRQVEEEEESYVRAARFEGNRRPPRTFTPNRNRVDEPLTTDSKIEKRVEVLEKAVNSLTESMKEMQNSFRALESKLTLKAATNIAHDMKRKKEPREKINPTDEKAKNVCFYCNEEGHFRNRCPYRKKAAQVGGYVTDSESGDSSDGEYDDDLNGKGSEL